MDLKLIRLLKSNQADVTNPMIESINRALKQVTFIEKATSKQKKVEAVQKFLRIYNSLHRREKQHLFEFSTRDELDTIREGVKTLRHALLKLVVEDLFTVMEAFSTSIILNDILARIVIQKRLRWIQIVLTSIKKIQFKQYIFKIISNSWTLLGSNQLKNILTFVKILFELKAPLPKRRKNVYFQQSVTVISRRFLFADF